MERPSLARHAIGVAGTVYTLTDSGNGLVDDGIVVGQQIRVEGFTDNADFVAIVTAVAAGSLTFVAPFDEDTRQPVVPVAEIAGDTVTITPETFSELLGQANTTYSKSADSIDISDKNSGNWGASLAGTVTMTVNASGFIEFTTDGTNGRWERVRDALDSGARNNYRLKLGSDNSSYYGPFAVSSQEGGGGHNEGNSYGFTLTNAGRPAFTAGW